MMWPCVACSPQNASPVAYVLSATETCLLSVHIEQTGVLNLLERHGSGFKRGGAQLQLRDGRVVIEVFKLRELLLVVKHTRIAAHVERSNFVHARTGRCLYRQ